MNIYKITAFCLSDSISCRTVAFRKNFSGETCQQKFFRRATVLQLRFHKIDLSRWMHGHCMCAWGNSRQSAYNQLMHGFVIRCLHVSRPFFLKSKLYSVLFYTWWNNKKRVVTYIYGILSYLLDQSILIAHNFDNSQWPYINWNIYGSKNQMF